MFTGRQYDAETGLYYYRTRYLDPGTGRFTTRDTIGIWGDPMNLGNGYTYVGNNPWTMVDPYGEGFFSWAMTGVWDTQVSNAELAGAAARGAAEGARGGASIVANTMTFGGTDYVGATNSSQYRGTAYSGSRVSATVGREVLITAGTLGMAQAARAGSAVASYGTAVVAGVDLGLGAHDVGYGLGRVSEGDYWGFLQAGAGAVRIGTGAAGVRQSCPTSVGPQAPKSAGAAPQVSTKGYGNVGGGATTAENGLTQAGKYLGPGYKEISPGVYRSADGTRQFRMTNSDLLDPKQGPHVHFESIGPDRRTITENSHVTITNP